MSTKYLFVSPTCTQSSFEIEIALFVVLDSTLLSYIWAKSLQRIVYRYLFEFKLCDILCPIKQEWIKSVFNHVQEEGTTD